LAAVRYNSTLAIVNPQQVRKIRNDQPEVRTGLNDGETQDGFNLRYLKSDELKFLTIISANKVVILCSVDLLYCVY
jgi:hypothetical protein